MRKLIFNVSVSFVILFVAGAIFYFSPNWLILPISAFVWFLFEVWQTSKEGALKNKLLLALFMGLFLALFDFAVENLGAQFGYWVSFKSNLFLLAVPIEVFFTCFFGGAAYFFLISGFKWSWKNVLMSAVIWSIGGTAGEFYLNMVGFMRYGNGWLSIPNAFLSYIAVWFLLHGFYYFINSRHAKKCLGH